jgi:hypothetical protein
MTNAVDQIEQIYARATTRVTDLAFRNSVVRLLILLVL